MFAIIAPCTGGLWFILSSGTNISWSMREKEILKHLSSGNGSHAWRCNLASHLLENSDQNFPMSLNWLQSKHGWWHRHCTQCHCSNYPRGTGMKMTVMGITKALLAQNVDKSWDQINFSRVQWQRDTALEELFARAALVNEKLLTQPCVMFLLDALGHHFLVQCSNLFPIYLFYYLFSNFFLNKGSQGCTGNPCWEMHLVQGAGKFPQLTLTWCGWDWLRH